INALEILEVGEVDLHSTVTRTHRDADSGLEVVTEELFELEQAGWPQARTRGRGLGRGTRCRRFFAGADRIFDLADRKVLARGTPGELLLEGAVGRAEEGASMAHAERAVLQVALDGRRELEEAQRIGDGRPALADAGRDLVVGEREVLDQLLVSRGFF